MMRTLFLLLCLLGIFSQPLWAQSTFGRRNYEETEEVNWGLALGAESYFYNAEFAHPLKPGYTLPGVSVHPEVWRRVGEKLYLNGGYFYAYMHGKSGAQVHKPTLSIAAQLATTGRGSFWCRLGTLTDAHPLPEAIYSPQYTWLHGPEAGAQLCWQGGRYRIQTWIDWDRFIWKDANDEERFLYGLEWFNHAATGQGSEQGAQPAFTYNAFFLARHHGGQIDTSHLRVVTSTNAGLSLGWACREGTLCPQVKLHGFLSHDGHHDSPLPARNGWAVAGEASLLFLGQLQLGVGYFYGKNFISLRGEELYRSYSVWSDGAMRSERRILEGTIVYEEPITQSGRFSCGAKGYYDLALGRIDYDFYLRLQIALETCF